MKLEKIIMKTHCSLNITRLLAVVATIALVFASVCNGQQPAIGPLPRPGNILIYDFAVVPAEVPANSAVAGQVDDSGTPQTDEQVAQGRKLCAQIVAQLVGAIHDMGMPAQQVPAGTRPQINDLLIRGFLVSIKEGDKAKRLVIGFGSGGSELRTVVEGYQMTPQGLRKLGAATVESGSRKTPGTAVGAATFIATANPAGLIVSSGIKVYGEASGNSTLEGRAKATAKEIADRLKLRFQEQGWISQ
jgi:hypothetical protein